MANPPFNVDGVKVESIGTHPLFATYGLPVSNAKSDKKSDTFSNANYLWISLFANALNRTGRAGFVMANSASDARGGEAEVRQRMIEAGLVDVMITLASNFFYTVTLPVTLWFFDQAKTNPTHPRHDQTLFIDARKIYNQVSGHHVCRKNLAPGKGQIVYESESQRLAQTTRRSAGRHALCVGTHRVF